MNTPAALFLSLTVAAAHTLDLVGEVLSGTATVASDTATSPSGPPTVLSDIQIRFDITFMAHDRELRDPDWHSALPEELELVRADRAGSPAPTAANFPELLPPNISFVLTLRALAPGEYLIGPVPLVAVSLSDERDDLVGTTTPVSVVVESLLPEEDVRLADQKDPLDPPRDWGRMAVFAGGGAIALALLIAGIAAVVRRPRPAPAVPSVPAHETALAELDALLATGVIERAAWKPFYADLTGLLRRYIERHFDLHAPTQTTEEFLRDPRTRTALTSAQAAEIRALLAQADAVKFAEGPATATAARAAAETTRHFIHETAAEPPSTEEVDG